MKPEIKKAILIFGGGILLYWAFSKIRPFVPKTKVKKSKAQKSTASAASLKDAAVVMTAYKNAMQAGETKAFLDEMNVEFAKEYQLKVYTDKGSGKLFVADLQGNKVL
jgi:hypothetical protein